MIEMLVSFVVGAGVGVVGHMYFSKNTANLITTLQNDVTYIINLVEHLVGQTQPATPPVTPANATPAAGVSH